MSLLEPKIKTVFTPIEDATACEILSELKDHLAGNYFKPFQLFLNFKHRNGCLAVEVDQACKKGRIINIYRELTMVSLLAEISKVLAACYHDIPQWFAGYSSSEVTQLIYKLKFPF